MKTNKHSTPPSRFRRFGPAFDRAFFVCPWTLFNFAHSLNGERYYKLPSVHWIRGHGAIRPAFAFAQWSTQAEVEYLLRHTILLDWISSEDFAERMRELAINLDALLSVSCDENKRWVLIAKVILNKDREAFAMLRDTPGGREYMEELHRRYLMKDHCKECGRQRNETQSTIKQRKNPTRFS